MQTIPEYYDGTTIRPLERIIAKPNQRVIITVMDEFVEPSKLSPDKSIRGILAEYADPALAQAEKGAWERAAIQHHDHT